MTGAAEGHGRPAGLEARLESARSALARGDAATARAVIEVLLLEAPGHVEGRVLRASACRLLGAAGDAAEDLDGLPGELEPGLPGSMDLLAATFRLRAFLRLDEGRTGEALADLLRGLELTPADGELHHWAGTLHMGEGRFAEARAHLEAALPTRGADAALWCSYGLVLVHLGDRAAGEQAYRRAVLLAPENPMPLLILAQLLAEAGRIPDTAPLLRRVLELAPGHPAAVSGHLATGLYDPTRTPLELAQAHRAWCGTLEARVQPLPPPVTEWNPDRRLKVAYLSADFREHSCAHFIEPLLRAHDPTQVEVVLYNASRTRDARTEVFVGLAGRFTDVAELADTDLVQLIRQDAVDVLVDLSGHSASNRLPVLAWRPAPVQLEWLGYPFTTGFTRLDGRVTDSRVDPPGSEAFSSEPLLRLDPCYLCWQPPAGAPDPVAAPSAAGAPFTFGSFNQFAKLNGAVVETWAVLMREVPGSRLLLKGKGASDPVLKGRLLQDFARLGVGEDRILMAPFTDDPASHFAQYHRVDLALDPFPYNGVTTTIEALWMGVPVLALEGPHSVARQGSAMLGLLGLQELVADGPEAYVAIGAALAAQPDRLRAVRAGLRARLAASPICDAQGFARRMEGLYRQLWRGACERARSAH